MERKIQRDGGRNIAQRANTRQPTASAPGSARGLQACEWKLDIPRSPEGRKQNSPGPKAFGPGDTPPDRIALKAPPARHAGAFLHWYSGRDCLTRAAE